MHIPPLIMIGAVIGGLILLLIGIKIFKMALKTALVAFMLFMAAAGYLFWKFDGASIIKKTLNSDVGQTAVASQPIQATAVSSPNQDEDDVLNPEKARQRKFAEDQREFQRKQAEAESIRKQKAADDLRSALSKLPTQWGEKVGSLKTTEGRSFDVYWNAVSSEFNLVMKNIVFASIPKALVSPYRDELRNPRMAAIVNYDADPDFSGNTPKGKVELQNVAEGRRNIRWVWEQEKPLQLEKLKAAFQQNRMEYWQVYFKLHRGNEEVLWRFYMDSRTNSRAEIGGHILDHDSTSQLMNFLTSR